MRAELVLVHETEAACRERLLTEGFDGEAATRITSYLAQSTDIAPEFDAIADACTARGFGFLPVELDDAPGALAARRGSGALVWTLTDGIAYFRGGAAPALARLNGLSTVGSDDSLFALCQDKFRSGAVLRALGLPVPEAGLARDGRFLVEPPQSETGWFVKPNRLGAKIGIWADSHVASHAAALSLSRRVFAAFRDDVVVQPYVPGLNARASFLAVERDAGEDALGVALVDSGGDFQTMDDSMALYGATGEAARREGGGAEPVLAPLAGVRPQADRAVRTMAARMKAALGLRDVFSIDLRVEDDGRMHLIEFEVCPGLPCFDFRAYCRDRWGMTLAEAMAATAAARIAS